MKEGAIIHRFGVLALCETKGCHRINDTLCWICRQITGLCPAPVNRLPIGGDLLSHVRIFQYPSVREANGSLPLPGLHIRAAKSFSASTT